MRFVGRSIELGRLEQQLAPVLAGEGGRALLVNGRRRVGKSRLVEEFCERSGLPYVVFQATRGRPPAAERGDFLAAVARSPLSGAAHLEGLVAPDWTRALRSLALAVANTPAIVVLDELPWLMEQDREVEGALQTAWDQELSRLPVLLVLVGSDSAVMQALQSPTRAFHRRAVPMTVEPLSPADVQDMTGLAAADAVDATLVTGGYPELVTDWPSGATWRDHLTESLRTPLSPLLVAGRLTLLGEFPETSLNAGVLRAVGSGERTFSTIATAAGGAAPLAAGTLSPLLQALVARGVLAVDRPLSAKLDTRTTRYRIADPYLRFWLALLADGIPLVERGRGDLVMARIEASWSSWRGRAVEPLVREAVARLAPGAGWPDVATVGGWWNRANNPEVDLVGADRDTPARHVRFVGSVKWHEATPFGPRERYELERDAVAVPGADGTTPLVAVSRAGATSDLDLAAVWGPEDVVDAFRP
ncbi:MAG: ATP-binding protein [Kineosporiaceae bacterium]